MPPEKQPDWSRISETRPLRCVQFRSGNHKIDQAALDAWLEKVEEHYVLQNKMTYPFTFYNKQENAVRAKAFIDVFEFLPKDKENPVPLTEIEAPVNYLAMPKEAETSGD